MIDKIIMLIVVFLIFASAIFLGALLINKALPIIEAECRNHGPLEWHYRAEGFCFGVE